MAKPAGADDDNRAFMDAFAEFCDGAVGRHTSTGKRRDIGFIKAADVDKIARMGNEYVIGEPARTMDAQ